VRASDSHSLHERLALPPDTSDLDWDGNTVETIPKDLALSVRRMYLTVDIGAYEYFAPVGDGGDEDD